ncbi:MAG: SirB2 family protein [Paraperlucidibaca sp.]
MFKHPHMLTALLLAIVYLWRGFYLLTGQAERPAKLLRIAPHILATLMIITGFGMVFQFGAMPGWALLKLVLLVGFIVCGSIAFQRSRGTSIAKPVFAFGLGLLLIMGWLAIAKPSMGVFG